MGATGNIEAERLCIDYAVGEPIDSDDFIVLDENYRVVCLRRSASHPYERKDEELIGKQLPLDWCPEGQRQILEKLIQFVTTERAREFEGVKLRLALTMPSRGVVDFDCYFRKLSDGTTAVFWSSAVSTSAKELIHKAIDLLHATIDPKLPANFSAIAESDAIESLSARERQVFNMLGRGFRVGTIARRLFISAETVKNHRKAIYEKLSVHSQIELVTKFGSYSVPADER